VACAWVTPARPISADSCCALILIFFGERGQLLADFVILDGDPVAAGFPRLEAIGDHALDGILPRCRAMQRAQQLHALLDVDGGDRIAIDGEHDRLRLRRMYGHAG